MLSFIKQFFRKFSYWAGRNDGWFACEKMVVDRAREHPEYDERKVWEDLLQ